MERLEAWFRVMTGYRVQTRALIECHWVICVGWLLRVAKGVFSSIEARHWLALLFLYRRCSRRLQEPEL
jgi:hypothetical protein